MLRTVQPWSRTNCLQTAEPMKPAPPVTMTRIQRSVEEHRELAQARLASIRIREMDFCPVDGPIDAEGRIIPQKTAIALARIVGTRLVYDLGIGFKRAQPVRKSFGNEELLPVVGRQFHRD